VQACISTLPHIDIASSQARKLANMADIETHASLTVTAAGLLIAHLYVAASTLCPVPSYHSFDGSREFVARCHKEINLARPQEAADLDSYARMLMVKSFSGAFKKSLTAMPDEYIGPNPKLVS
jgi:hypothetical protein